MTLTIAAIATKALNAVQGAITGAVKVATLTRRKQGAYNVTTGAYATVADEQTGRAVATSMTPSRAASFAPFIAGPSDGVYMLAGFGSVAENDVMTIAGRPSQTIKAVQDIGGAGAVWYVIAR